MKALLIATHSVPRQATLRRWRRLFAALISVAFALSFFHGLSFDNDDVAPAMSIAQAACDTTGKVPVHPAPLHGDHCLTHLSSVTPQETSIAIEYVAHGCRIVSMRSPDRACPRSPFEPPRA
jgi:hypothetical protein